MTMMNLPSFNVPKNNPHPLIFPNKIHIHFSYSAYRLTSNELTLYSKVPCEMLVLVQMVKKFPSLYGTYVSSPRSQAPVIETDTEVGTSSPHRPFMYH